MYIKSYNYIEEVNLTSRQFTITKDIGYLYKVSFVLLSFLESKLCFLMSNI